MEHGLDLSDEEFVKQFATLSADSPTSKIVELDKQAEATTNWNLCLLLRVCTDKVVIADSFARQIALAWRAHGGVKIRAMERKGHFLAEFSSMQDLAVVRDGAPWTFRSDFVAVQQVKQARDATEGLVTNFEV